MKITDKVVLMKISKTYRSNLERENPEELYKVTRQAWRAKLSTIQNYKIVFSVYQRSVKEIYEVDKWDTRERIGDKDINLRDEALSRESGNTNWKKRVCFVGKVSDDKALREKYLYKDISEYCGGQNPVRYVN